MKLWYTGWLWTACGDAGRFGMDRQRLVQSRRINQRSAIPNCITFILYSMIIQHLIGIKCIKAHY